MIRIIPCPAEIMASKPRASGDDPLITAEVK